MRRLRVRAMVAVMLVGAVMATRADADENAFGYTYGTETLMKGKSEYYFWLTSRAGKGDGHYRAWDNMNEFERGLTDRLQVAFYLNTSGHDIAGHSTLPDTSSFGVEGVRTAFKYSIASPYRHPLGVAVYVEPEFSRRDRVTGAPITEWAIESKLLLQKQLLSDRVSTAVNVTYEHEWEREAEDGEVETERESALEVSAGANYRVANAWFLGVEGRWHAAYEGAWLNEQEHRAWFLGPTVHWRQQRWWMTGTIQPQMGGSPAAAGRRVSLDDYERLEVRIKVGYNF